MTTGKAAVQQGIKPRTSDIDVRTNWLTQHPSRSTESAFMYGIKLPLAFAGILGLLSLGSASPVDSTDIDARSDYPFPLGVNLYAPARTYAKGIPKEGEDASGWGGWGNGDIDNVVNMSNWLFRFNGSYKAETFELWTYKDNGDWKKDKDPEEKEKLVVSSWRCRVIM